MTATATADRGIVLASASPRRLELLRQIGVEPALVDPPEVDEAPRQREIPLVYARRVALAKLEAAARRHDGRWIIAADTVVALGRRILPKAASEAEARLCLDLLGGRRHRVLGAIAVRNPEGRRSLRVVTTMVAFKRLSPAEVERYLAGGEWMGKAGAYAIQGRAAAFIPTINGSYSNVVGLSLSDAAAMLTGLGWVW